VTELLPNDLESLPTREEMAEKMRKRVEDLERENIKLATALRFYAEPGSYAERYEHVPYGSTTAAMPLGTEVGEDGGYLAREALGLPQPSDDIPALQESPNVRD
jgi:hypothetical protein